MMDGMIHEKTDTKILILYVMSRLAAPAEPETVYELCLCDRGVDYFFFTDCFHDLVALGQIEEAEDDDEYAISEKGRANAAVLESELPYTVRRAADALIAPENEKLRRLGMITASYETAESGCTARFAMSDRAGEIFEMKLLCADEKQAKLMKRNFRRNAETYYREIISLLSEDTRSIQP